MELKNYNSPRDTESRTLQNAIQKLTFNLLILTSCLILILIHNDPLVVAKNLKQQQQQQSQQQQATYLQRPDSNGRTRLMVASYCPSQQQIELTSTSQQQYYPQYLEIGTGKWRSYREPNSLICPQDKQEILNLCKKAYPDHEIRNIVESSRSYKVENWCRINTKSKRCHGKFTVKPYRCLEGTFQSEALLVPDGCLFDHLHNKTICESNDNWQKIASQNCYYKSMKLESYAMLQPCGLGIFSGIEFVCCPQEASSSSTPSTGTQPTSERQHSASSNLENPVTKPATTELQNESSNENQNNIPFAQIGDVKSQDQWSKKNLNTNKDQEADGDSKDSTSDEDDDDTWNSNEDDDDEDEYDDDSSSPSSQSSDVSSSSTTSTTTTTTSTTTTQRPIDHYLAHFDVTHERDEFKQAELAVENTYKEKLNSVIKNWSQINGHYEDLKKRDPQAAEQFKKTMTANLEKTIQALEEEAENQRHQLAAMHAERAMALINRRKKSAMDCLTQALDKDPIRIKQVERCIVKLLKALEKDREHTFRQYKNLLILNTRDGLHEKKIILDHLVTLNRAANQSIAMLHRSSVLVDELKSKVVGLWHRMRKIPLDQPIDRELEVKMMEKIEEEVAQRKIKQERDRLNYIKQGFGQEVAQKNKKVNQQGEQQPQQHQQRGFDVNNNKEAKQTASQSINNNTISINDISVINDNNNNNKLPTSSSTFEQITPQQVMVKQQQTNGGQPMDSTNSTISLNELSPSDDMDNEIRDHGLVAAPKFSHLKADPSHHELTFSIKHEPIGENGSRWTTTHPYLLISACTLVLAISLMGVKYYNKNSARAYKRQGFAEVGRSCPEEKTLTNLQFNGYENPAYKFFEAEA